MPFLGLHRPGPLDCADPEKALRRHQDMPDMRIHATHVKRRTGRCFFPDRIKSKARYWRRTCCLCFVSWYRMKCPNPVF